MRERFEPVHSRVFFVSCVIIVVIPAGGSISSPNIRTSWGAVFFASTALFDLISSETKQQLGDALKSPAKLLQCALTAAKQEARSGLLHDDEKKSAAVDAATHTPVAPTQSAHKPPSMPASVVVFALAVAWLAVGVQLKR